MNDRGVTTSCTVVPLFVQPMYPAITRRIVSSLEAKAVPPENDIAVYAIGSVAWYAEVVDSLVSRASKDSLTVVSNIGEQLVNLLFFLLR